MTNEELLPILLEARQQMADKRNWCVGAFWTQWADDEERHCVWGHILKSAGVERRKMQRAVRTPLGLRLLNRIASKRFHATLMQVNDSEHGYERACEILDVAILELQALVLTPLQEPAAAPSITRKVAVSVA